MNIRKLLTSVLIMISIFITSTAAGQNTARFDEKVRKMTELLKLSSEQQAKYKTLLINSDKEKNELMEKSKTVSPEEKKKMQNQYKSNYEKQLKKILTAEQFKKLNDGAKNKK